jgi:hypothetical protein
MSAAQTLIQKGPIYHDDVQADRRQPEECTQEHRPEDSQRQARVAV